MNADVSNRNSLARLASKLDVSLLLLVTASALALQSLSVLSEPDAPKVKLNLLIQLVLVVLFGFWAWSKSRSHLSAPFILLTAEYLWHSPFLTGHLFDLPGVFAQSGNFLRIGANHIPAAVALVGLCLAMTAFGAFSGFAYERLRAARNGQPREIPESAVILRDRGIRQFVWALLFVYLALTLVYFYVEGSRAFAEDYISSYVKASGSLLYRTYQATKFFSVILILCLFALSHRERFQITWALVCVSALMLLQLMTGARSMPFINFLAVFVAFDYFVRRHRFWLIGLAAVALSAVSHVVGTTRATKLGVGVFDFASTGQTLDIWHSLYEMGGTVQTVLRTMAFVPDTGFEYGRSFLDAIVYLAPRVIVDGLGLRTEYTVPSVLLVENSPDVPEGGGLGYSLVAESYLNFGMWGCLLFLLLGWFVAHHAFRYTFSRDRFCLLHSLNVGVVLALHMRNDAGTYMRLLIYGYIAIELLRWLSTKRRQPLRSLIAPTESSVLRPHRSS